MHGSNVQQSQQTSALACTFTSDMRSFEEKNLDRYILSGGGAVVQVRILGN